MPWGFGKHERITRGQSVDLPGGSMVDVVGESFYEPALRGLIDDSNERTRWASLIPEPENPYDANCVGVWIGGVRVGHLSRENAIVFRPVSERIRELGCEARCAATILGGGHVGPRGPGWKGDDRLYGVVLELGTPDQCLDCLK